MHQDRQETRLERARRYVREGEERIERITRFIEDVRAREHPTEHLERLLDQYYEWLLLAQRHLMDEKNEVARQSTEPHSSKPEGSP